MEKNTIYKLQKYREKLFVSHASSEKYKTYIEKYQHYKQLGGQCTPENGKLPASILAVSRKYNKLLSKSAYGSIYQSKETPECVIKIMNYKKDENGFDVRETYNEDVESNINDKLKSCNVLYQIEKKKMDHFNVYLYDYAGVGVFDIYAHAVDLVRSREKHILEEQLTLTCNYINIRPIKHNKLYKYI